MRTATRKIISKEIQQDADQYVGEHGELWFQEGESQLRLGNGNTPGGVPVNGNVGDHIVSDSPPPVGTWLETGKYYLKSAYPELATHIGDVPDIGDPVNNPAAQLPVGFNANGLRTSAVGNGRLVVIGLAGRVAYSDDGENFKYSRTNTSVSLNGIRNVNNRFIVCGNSGIILWSINGIDWTTVTLSTNLTDSAYGADIYVVVGATGSIFYSTNLNSWTQVTGIDTATNFVSVVFADNQFVAAGSNGFMYTSSNGITWQKAFQDLRSLAMGSGVWIAVGDGGAIIRSSNGTTWTIVSNVGSNRFNKVIFANNTFVAVGDNGACYTSADGTTWTSRSVGTASFNDIAYGASLFVAVGSAGNVYTSSAGTSWAIRAISTGADITRCVFANNRFIVLADRPYYSDNGTSWTTSTGGAFSGPLRALAFGNAQWYASGENNDNFSNDNGATWTSIFANGARDVIYAFSLWIIARTQNSTIVTSTTDAPGTRTQRVASVIINSFFSNGTTLVAVGNSGVILTTTNGTTWTTITSPVASNLTVGLFGSGTFLAVGQNRVSISSTNTTSWTLNEGLIGQVNFLDYKNGNWMYCTSAGLVFVGANIQTDPVAITPVSLNHIDLLNGNYVVVGNSDGTNGVTFTSSDGVNWTSRPIVSNRNWSFVAFYNGLYYVLGASGVYATSSDLASWNTLVDIDYNNMLSAREFANRFIILGVNSCFSMLPTRQVILSDGSIRYSISINNRSLPRVVDFGTGLFIKCGAGGAILTSPDGLQWTARYSGTIVNLDKTYFLNNRFLVFGASGVICSSTSGESWTATTAGAQTLNAAAFGGGTWVVVGAAASVWYSTNGTSWTQATGTGTGNFQDIIYANSQFIAVGSNGSIYTSSNGVSWTPRGSFPTTFPPQFNKVIVAGSVYYIAGTNGIYTSTDGINWQASWWNTTTNNCTCRDIIYANNILVASINSPNAILRSADGITWTQTNLPVDTPLGLSASSQSYLCTTQVNTGPSLIKSTDGINWTRTPTASMGHSVSTAWPCLAYLSNRYILIGSSNYTTVTSVSLDQGETWQNWNHINYVAYGSSNLSRVAGIKKINDKYFFINGWAWISSDGISFTRISGFNLKTVADITYGNGIYLAVTGYSWGNTDNPSRISESPIVWSSIDGYNWSMINKLSTNIRLSPNQEPLKCEFALGNFVVMFRGVCILDPAQASSVSAYYSSNNGQTLIPSSGATFSSGITSDGTTLFASNGVRLFKSLDGGVSWLRSYLNRLNPRAISVGVNSRLQYVNGIIWANNMYSLDGGVVWKYLDPPPGVPDFSDEGNFRFLSRPSAIYATGDILYFTDTNSSNSIKYYNKNSGDTIGTSVMVSEYAQNVAPDDATVCVSRDDTLLLTTIQISSDFRNNNAVSSVTGPWVIQERPLYSYNTNTTFWIPPAPSSEGKTYIYAGDQP